MIGSFSKLVVEVCANTSGKFNDPFLRFAAVNALCKYMLVSESFCDDNLSLLFSILSGQDSATLRASIAIALGDLNVRFPNRIDQYRDYFYERLRDENVNVRKNTLLVLTHLILHDMIKPKDQISSMAMCLEDSEQRISDLARLFFYELAAKENASAIYNIIPGMISGLSQISGLPFESVQNIVRFLFSFIQKEKQLESLIDRLCQRFGTGTTNTATHQEPKQAEYLAYCLACLPSWSDRGVKRLTELFPKYKDALNYPPVLDHFQSILNKARRNAKQELKDAVDELEQKINEAVDPEKIEAAHQAAMAAAAARGETLDEDFAPKRTATKGRGKRTGAAKRGGAAKKTGGRGKKTGRGRKAYDDDDEEEEDDMMDSSSEEEEEAPKRAAPKRSGAKRVATKKVAADSSDDDDDMSGEEPVKPVPKRAAAKRVGKKVASDSDENDLMELDDDEPQAKRPAPRRGAVKRKKVEQSSNDDSDDE